MRARLTAVAAALGCAVALTGASTASSGAPALKLPRVTLIADSVGTSLWFDTGAKAILGRGVDLFLEPGEGRRLGGAAVPGDASPLTALQLIPTLGRRLGPTVVMAVGYNDLGSQYAANMEIALAELRAAGVKHIVWLTLHVSPQHLGNVAINEAIAAEAVNHPELTVLDWNSYANSHPEWFQGDGVHLVGDGPRALARFIEAGLVKLAIPALRR
jgi:hypothetical protein